MADANLPKRKHVRIKEYNYSLPGAYFVTICTKNRRCTLSRIVGRGLAPAEEGLSQAEEPAVVELTQIGELAKNNLVSLENKYPNLKIDSYVIMPNHIHVIFVLTEAAGASPRPTVMDIVCAYKSLTVRECKAQIDEEFGFQTSFYEHVIRGREDYEEHIKYINENPMRWYYDELFEE